MTRVTKCSGHIGRYILLGAPINVASMPGLGFRKRPRSVAALAVATAASTGVLAVSAVGASASTPHARTGDALDHALHALVDNPKGPPGIAVVLQRGAHRELRRAGTANLADGSPMRTGDSMRLASVSKAFNGAAALTLVSRGRLALTDTIGRSLPGLPRAWSRVTLRELLQHTSGLSDYISSPKLAEALSASPFKAPPPRRLLSYAKKRLAFQPGTKYAYSNTDNIVAALMVRKAYGRSYEAALRNLVYRPFGLRHTSLPRSAAIASPYIHGYDVSKSPPEDDTRAFAAGWAWASGGIVSTPRDANAFVRAYVRGATIDRMTRKAQFTFRPGSSEPPGPGRNSAGLGLFRYQTRCGTVYGHTGSTAGYTQFVAATPDGRRSVAVSANAQINPHSDATTFKELRHVYTLAVCAVLRG